MGERLAALRGFWRAFRSGEAPTQIRHHGHDLARTAQDATTISRSRGAGGFSGSSAVERHIVAGASDYAKSFDRRRDEQPTTSPAVAV